MNILFLANNLLSPNSGGIERTTFNLITELSRDSNFKIFGVFLKTPEKIEHVTFVEDVISTGKQIADYINLYKIDIVVFPAGAWYTNLLKGYKPKINCKIITCLHSPPKVGEEYIIKNLNLDWQNMTVSKKLQKIPYYVLTYFKQPFRIKSARRQYHRGYNNSNAYVLLSKFYFDDFKEYARLPNIEKLFAIGNALSFDDTFKIENLSNKKNEILVVARFDEISKRISFVLRAWQLISAKDWKLLIVGFGKDEYLYRKIIDRDNIRNVSLEGKQNPILYYQRAKIFVMTSSFEGWPMTLLEAIQMGCVPIVMNSFGSLSDIIVNNYNGIIVENGDVAGMSKALELLICNEEEWLRLSENAIKSSSNFTIEKSVKKWKCLFEELFTSV